MLASSLLVLASAFVSFAAAQNTTACCTIDPNSVDSPTRQSWCRAQTNSCPSICGGRTQTNMCDPNALTYSCVCQGSNTPNISDYSQTLPALECESWKAQCVAAHPNDLAGQTICLGYTCGQRNASSNAVATSSASSSASATSGAASSSGSATGTASSSGTATAASASASASKTGAAVALYAAENYGTGIFAAGVMAVLGFAL